MKNQTKNPFLEGHYAPWPMEGDIPRVFVKGAIPKNLNGVFFRNGPNPQFPVQQAHWFEGDGMLHAFYFNDGNVRYSNRWIRTERFSLENKAQKSLFGAAMGLETIDASVLGVNRNTANTNIIYHAGKLLALQESSLPLEIEPQTLVTKEYFTAGGKIIDSFCAHPHFDAENGEMHGYAYSKQKPEIVYYVFNRQGEVIKAEKIAIPYCSLMHDFFITKDYVIFPVLPLTIDFERRQRGQPPILWEPEKGAHIGIMPRHGTQEDIHWFEMDSFYVFHYMNAYQDSENIILDGMKTARTSLFPDAAGKLTTVVACPTRLTRWCFNLKTGAISETQLDNTHAEFPRFDERYTGLLYRHGFVAACLEPQIESKGFDAMIHYDHHQQSQTVRKFSKGDIPNEPIFVPRSIDAAEGDGYLLSLVYRAAENRTDLLILDAMNIDQEPIAIVQLPHRVPDGFHGNWCDMANIFN